MADCHKTSSIGGFSALNRIIILAKPYRRKSYDSSGNRDEKNDKMAVKVIRHAANVLKCSFMTATLLKIYLKLFYVIIELLIIPQIELEWIHRTTERQNTKRPYIPRLLLKYIAF
jgi:hypothetical protein